MTMVGSLVTAVVGLGVMIGGIQIYNIQISDKVINLATKPMTEQCIIGAMVKEMVEDRTNISVYSTFGGTSG